MYHELRKRGTSRMIRCSRQRFALLATVAVFGTHAWAQGDGQRSKPTGAWRLETAPDSDAQQESFSLVTSAVDNKDATFALGCRPSVPLYFFALHDTRLALPAGAEVTLSVRYPDAEPVRWQVTASGDGSVVLQERVHQTAFTLMLTSLRQTTVSTIELAVDDHRSTFRLEGFAASLAALIDACGSAPGPARATTRKRSSPGPEGARRDQPDLRLPPRAR